MQLHNFAMTKSISMKYSRKNLIESHWLLAYSKASLSDSIVQGLSKEICSLRAVCFLLCNSSSYQLFKNNYFNLNIWLKLNTFISIFSIMKYWKRHHHSAVCLFYYKTRNELIHYFYEIVNFFIIFSFMRDNFFKIPIFIIYF